MKYKSLLIYKSYIYTILFNITRRRKNYEFVRVNSISLVGNIASVSDIKEFPSGKKYKCFDLCQNIKYKDTNKIEQESKNYFSVRVYGGQIEKYNAMLEKGKWIHVIGRINSYISTDGIKKYYVSVNSIKEMSKNKVEFFDYDWLNDTSESSHENVL